MKGAREVGRRNEGGQWGGRARVGGRVMRPSSTPQAAEPLCTVCLSIMHSAEPLQQVHPGVLAWGAAAGLGATRGGREL